MFHTLSKLALVGFFGSAIVHVLASLLLEVVSEADLIGYFHLPLMALGALVLIGESLRGNKERTFKYAPGWARSVWYVLFAYTCIQMFVLVSDGEWTREQRHERSVVGTRASDMPPLAEGHSEHQIQELRTFSAGWMTGYFFVWVVTTTEAKRELD